MSEEFNVSTEANGTITVNLSTKEASLLSEALGAAITLTPNGSDKTCLREIFYELAYAAGKGDSDD